MKKQALFLVLALVFLEWLDFSLYLYLARSVFSKTFFPVSSYSLILTFALFAAAYLVRPIGGWFFGLAADLHGRRRPMLLSAALMGIATIGICFLPSYAQIGIWSTWGLLILRAAQGLALGGEINTSAMFMVEHHPQRPLLAGSFVAASGALGMFFGAAIAALLQADAFNGGWRFVFAAVGLISLWVCRRRAGLAESPEFHQKRSDVRGLWQRYWRGLLTIAVIAVYVSVTVYISNIFWVSYAIEQHLWSKTQCAWTGAFAQLASALIALPIAYFFRPFYASRLMQMSMLLTSLVAPLLYYFTVQHNGVAVFCLLIGYVLANALFNASLYYVLYLQLPVEYRCRGVSTVWAIAASVGAISLPITAQAVNLGMHWFPGGLVSLVAVLSLLVFRFNFQQAWSSEGPLLSDDYCINN